MTAPLHYGTTAKVFHWLIVLLLAVQYPIGWLMPDVHRGQQPGAAMSFHVSIGIIILAMMILRLIWRMTHSVAPDSSLPRWRRVSSETVHWLLYALVLVTTLTGWLFASFRGWSISFFFVAPLPMLASGNGAAIKAVNGLHQTAEWALLLAIAIHLGAAVVHMLVYRDRVVQRMLPTKW